MAKPTTKLSTQQTVNTWLPNSRIGSTGSRACNSTHTKSASAAAAAANSPMIIGDAHG